MVSDKTIYKALELFIKPYKNITIIFFTIHQNYALAILKDYYIVHSSSCSTLILIEKKKFLFTQNNYNYWLIVIKWQRKHTTHYCAQI